MLKTETTFAIPKVFGNIPFKKNLLINSDNGPDISVFGKFKNFYWFAVGT